MPSTAHLPALTRLASFAKRTPIPAALSCLLILHLSLALLNRPPRLTLRPGHALLSLPAHLGPVAFGPSNSADIKDKLAPILRDRGVPDDRIEERIALAMQKIPPSDILQALNSKNAWPTLKALASRAHIAFMWIHPDELSRKIRERASSQFGVERSNRKQQGRGGQRGDAQPTLVNLDPHQLELVPGTFQCSDGTDAMQVAFSLIDPDQQRKPPLSFSRASP